MVVVVVVVVEAFEDPLQLAASNRVDRAAAHSKLRVKADKWDMGARFRFWT